MFTGSVKITFEEFIRKYNEWTLKKSKEAKDLFKNNPDLVKKNPYMDYWFSNEQDRRVYLRPFEKLIIDPSTKNPSYHAKQHSTEKAILQQD